MIRAFLIILFLASLCAMTVQRNATPLSIPYPSYFSNRTFVPADNPTTVEGVALGRRLFYDTHLSANNKISCATCHQQSRAFTDGKRFSVGVDGKLTPRNAMSLANLLWVRRYFWDGRADGLELQAAFPITDPHEMGQSLESGVQKLKATKEYPALFTAAFGPGGITGDRITKALAQFERTLVSANSRYDAFLRGEYLPTPAERNGMDLFFRNPEPARNIRGAGCGHCHGGAKTFIELFHNNGLDSIPADAGRETITGQAIDKGRFRVATLRNIALTAPYMHDGRFATLESVLDHYNEHVQQSDHLSIFLQDNVNDTTSTQLGLTVEEKKHVIAFLHMLTDSSFITDKRFSNPFINQ